MWLALGGVGPRGAGLVFALFDPRYKGEMSAMAMERTGRTSLKASLSSPSFEPRRGRPG